jgi:hypothetical protein
MRPLDFRLVISACHMKYKYFVIWVWAAPTGNYLQKFLGWVVVGRILATTLMQ